MLVLTRSVEQEIVIGDEVRVKVLAISGNQVRLGIEAPGAVGIFRREIHDEVCRQNAEAAVVRPEALAGLLGGKALVERR
ncbi:MAG: carbon storage regulator CsrA [Armatimonadia bacterium]